MSPVCLFRWSLNSSHDIRFSRKHAYNKSSSVTLYSMSHLSPMFPHFQVMGAHPIPPSNSSQWSFSPHWSFTSENILLHLTLPPSLLCFRANFCMVLLPRHLRPLEMAVLDSSKNLILNVLSEEPCHDTMLQFCWNCSKNITFHNQYQ